MLLFDFIFDFECLRKTKNKRFGENLEEKRFAAKSENHTSAMPSTIDSIDAKQSETVVSCATASLDV